MWQLGNVDPKSVKYRINSLRALVSFGGGATSSKSVTKSSTSWACHKPRAALPTLPPPSPSLATSWLPGTFIKLHNASVSWASSASIVVQFSAVPAK